MISISLTIQKEADGYRAYSLLYGNCIKFDTKIERLSLWISKMGFLVVN